MAKKQLLPPPVATQKRDISVNLRFSEDVYERLKRIAIFSNTSITGLLHYVTLNTTLPLMEKEMLSAQHPIAATDAPLLSAVDMPAAPAEE